MTMYQHKPVDWKLYPDLVLPNETAITLPRQVITAREREAFVQNQKRNYNLESSSARTARQACDSMLALLESPKIAQNARQDSQVRRQAPYRRIATTAQGYTYIRLHPCYGGLHNQIPIDSPLKL